jgi:phosphate starvation-inducible protein PhoH
LFGRGDAYELLKTKRVLDFMTTSFIRGNTFYDTIIIADEVNNMNFHELDSIITRLGENCRLMMCGDYRQSDLNRYEKNDLLSFIRILDDMKGFSHVEFQIEDIVRSGIVKEYIIAKHKHGIT